MEVQYVYVKTRSDFGKQCIFNNVGPFIEENLQPQNELRKNFTYKSVLDAGIQVHSQLALHEVQTEGKKLVETGVLHTEGGWPREINANDPEIAARYRKRVERSNYWAPKMRELTKTMEKYVLQNGTSDIYRHFFDDMIPTELVSPLDVRTTKVYADPQSQVRPVSSLSWSPDEGKQLAVAYCCTEFQKVLSDASPSYIWDLGHLGRPFMSLEAFCPSVTIEYNSRNPWMLISGLMSGQVCSWDIRSGQAPIDVSHLKFSHRSPANLALWINSKTNSEFFSASTDGLMKWWDIRKLRAPTETLVMDLEDPLRQSTTGAIGVSSLHYEPTKGNRFLAGMENGVVVRGTRGAKNALEKLGYRFKCHPGPVVAIDRHPVCLSNFLTVGDWTAKVWSQDVRENDLVSLKEQRVLLSGGCWSASKCSAFYLITMDGTLEVYDLLISMKNPVCTARLCDDALRAIKPQRKGSLVAVGDIKGNVYLIEPSEALRTSGKNDKALVTSYLERCSRFEKIIDTRLRELRLGKKLGEEVDDEAIKTRPKDKVRDKHKEKDTNKEKFNDKNKERSDSQSREKWTKEKSKSIEKKQKGKTTDHLEEVESRYFNIIQQENDKYSSLASLYDQEASTFTSSGMKKERREHKKIKHSNDITSIENNEVKESRTKVEGEVISMKRSIVYRGSSRNEPRKSLEGRGEKALPDEIGDSFDRLYDIDLESKASTKISKVRRKRVGDVKRLKLKFKTPCLETICKPEVCCRIGKSK